MWAAKTFDFTAPNARLWSICNSLKKDDNTVELSFVYDIFAVSFSHIFRVELVASYVVAAGILRDGSNSSFGKGQNRGGGKRRFGRLSSAGWRGFRSGHGTGL
jgi:hypothetical protein